MSWKDAALPMFRHNGPSTTGVQSVRSDRRTNLKQDVILEDALDWLQQVGA